MVYKSAEGSITLTHFSEFLCWSTDLHQDFYEKTPTCLLQLPGSGLSSQKRNNLTFSCNTESYNWYIDVNRSADCPDFKNSKKLQMDVHKCLGFFLFLFCFVAVIPLYFSQLLDLRKDKNEGQVHIHVTLREGFGQNDYYGQPVFQGTHFLPA